MKVLDFKDLIVWQKSMDLVEEVYEICSILPKDEIYSLSVQLKRSAVSIPSNIAEGHKRGHKKEYIHFLNIAIGSSAELYTQLLICNRVGYVSKLKIKKSLDLIDEISKMLSSIIKKLNIK